jgi:hypothetical protein
MGRFTKLVILHQFGARFLSPVGTPKTKIHPVRRIAHVRHKTFMPRGH